MLDAKSPNALLHCHPSESALEDADARLRAVAPFTGLGNGFIGGTLSIACDVTEREQMEQQLRRSHRQLTEVLERITDGFYALDHEWRLTYINHRAEQLLGLSKKTDIGCNIWEPRPEAIDSVFHRQYQSAIASGMHMSFEASFYDRWWEIDIYPGEDGLSVFFRDITERRAAFQALQESEARHRLVARITRDVIWDWDAKCDQFIISDAVESAFRYARHEVGSALSWWLQRIHPQDREHIRASFEAALGGTADTWREEYRFLKGDGTYADVLDRASILRDSGGKAIRAIGSMQDVSQQKFAAELEQERNGLRRAVKAMDRVLGVVGHELRTPLAGLRAMAELLIDLPKQSPKFDTLLQSAHDELPSLQEARQYERIVAISRSTGSSKLSIDAFRNLAETVACLWLVNRIDAPMPAGQSIAVRTGPIPLSDLASFAIQAPVAQAVAA